MAHILTPAACTLPSWRAKMLTAVPQCAVHDGVGDALRACQQAILRGRDEMTLVNEVCRLIVAVPAYRAAWVDYRNAGQDGGLGRIAGAWQGGEAADPAAEARRLIDGTGVGAVLDGHGPRIYRGLLISREASTSCVVLLPLMMDGEVQGVLTILSTTTDAFAEQEVGLLSALADGLAVGIGALRLREAHGQLQAQLQQARKMEAVGQLSGGIAHDFNNILSSILGYAGLALDRQSSLTEVEMQAYLTEVLRAGERARDLVGQMLVFSRSRKDEARRVALRPLIDEAVRMLRFTLPTSVELRIVLGEEDLALHIDPVKLQQIIMNLSINARDAMHNKGRLEIVANAVDLGEGADDNECGACHTRLAPGRYIELSIKDNGGGIAPALLERVFDPFFTTKEEGKGTGMGLAVVQGIVHEAGGHIVVDSVSGEGTTFRLLLPPAEALSGAETADAFSVEDARDLAGAAHILVVDDEPSVAGFLNELLSGAGYRVSLAANGQEALTQFDRQGGQIDLVITDHTMPELTGTELAIQLLARRPDLPIVLCTGYSVDVDAERAREMGIRAYMAKPLASRDLLARVAELLD